MACDAKQNVYASFRRLRDFPLDSSCRFETKSQAQEYCQTNIVYDGQIVSIYNDDENNGIYLISNRELLRATDTNDIDNLKSLVDDLSSNLEQLETLKVNKNTTDIANLTKRINNIGEELVDFVKQDEFNQLKRDVEFITSNDSLTDRLDSIKEIADWINSNASSLEHINLIAETVNEIALSYVTKDELNDRLSDVQIKTSVEYNFTSNGTINLLPIIKSGKVIIGIDVIIYTPGELETFTLSYGNIEFLNIDDIVTTEEAITSTAFHYTTIQDTYLSLTTSLGNVTGKIIVRLL